MYKKIPTAGMSNKEWLALRKTGIGGSDAGSICGVNPFGSPMKVYYDKTSSRIEELDNEAVRQGHDLENYVAQRFMEATGLKVRRSNFMYQSIENPFMIADIDRLVRMQDWNVRQQVPIMRTSGKMVRFHFIISCSVIIIWQLQENVHGILRR